MSEVQIFLNQLDERDIFIVNKTGVLIEGNVNKLESKYKKFAVRKRNRKHKK